ncbi:hypothetical protein Mapa_016658 [Marchantia paleacea]|nr:hypothetical protein Mapa_016658 [Marchantia paleacea]
MQLVYRSINHGTCWILFSHQQRQAGRQQRHGALVLQLFVTCGRLREITGREGMSTNESKVR